MTTGQTQIGSAVILSFNEAIPPDHVLYYIQDHHIGGIILFADHCRDQDSLKSWLYDVKKTLRRPLLVAIDQEGGRVQRLQHRFPTLEAPRYYGHHGKLDQYRSDLARACDRLFELGININLVPTVDLFDTEAGHVLDHRTFSDDPTVVRRFARETIAVHNAHGILTCAKHFPGLGRSAGDPHAMPAAADIGDDDFKRVELPPFKDCIEASVDAVMVTHLTAPKVDAMPAVVSQKIITGWLKTDLACPGPVITDDLQMAAAAEIGSLDEVAGASFAAGVDLLLFGRDFKKTTEALDIFFERFTDGAFGEDRLADAFARIDALTGKIPE